MSKFTEAMEMIEEKSQEYRDLKEVKDGKD